MNRRVQIGRTMVRPYKKVVIFCSLVGYIYASRLLVSRDVPWCVRLALNTETRSRGEQSRESKDKKHAVRFGRWKYCLLFCEQQIRRRIGMEK